MSDGRPVPEPGGEAPGGWPGGRGSRTGRSRRRGRRIDRDLILVAVLALVVGVALGAGRRFAESIGPEAEQATGVIGSLLSIGLVLGLLVAILRYFFRSADALVALLLATGAAYVAYPVGPVTSQSVEVVGTSDVVPWRDIVETRCRWAAGRWRVERVWGSEVALGGGRSYVLETVAGRIEIVSGDTRFAASTLDRDVPPPLSLSVRPDRAAGSASFDGRSERGGDLLGSVTWSCPVPPPG